MTMTRVGYATAPSYLVRTIGVQIILRLGDYAQVYEIAISHSLRSEQAGFGPTPCADNPPETTQRHLFSASMSDSAPFSPTENYFRTALAINRRICMATRRRSLLPSFRRFTGAPDCKSMKRLLLRLLLRRKARTLSCYLEEAAGIKIT